MSAKKIVSPFQRPMKNPGGSYASGMGWCAHDDSNSAYAISAATYNFLDAFVSSLHRGFYRMKTRFGPRLAANYGPRRSPISSRLAASCLTIITAQKGFHAVQVVG
jgi:hypothetical protein